MRASLLGLILAPVIFGCACRPPAPPAPLGERCVIRIFAVGDLTLQIDNPTERICFFYYEFPPSEGRDPRGAVPIDERVLVGLLRDRTGVEAADPRGFVIRMEGHANVLAIGPASVMEGVEDVLGGLRRAP